MAAKRKPRSSLPIHPNTIKKLKIEEEKTNHLPDLVIHQILLQLPTKLAVRASAVSKQWVDVCSSIPVLDLDEGDLYYNDVNRDKLQRRKFINFLKTCLKCRQKDHMVLDKCRLRMWYRGGSITVDKWLTFAIERRVKELDLSLPCSIKSGAKSYRLPHTLFAAKFITTLNLGHVRIKYSTESTDHHCISLPSIKTMSLKSVCFDDWPLEKLISGCPSIEYLSLTSCVGDGVLELKIFSSSIKSLEVMDCRSNNVQIEAMNLESFTFNSKYRLLDCMTLFDCRSLKYININGQHLKHLLLYGCQQASANATIHAPKMVSFDYSGYLNANVSVKAREVTLILLDYYSGPTFKLRDYLEKFGFSQTINLHIYNAEVVIFPKKFRTTCSPPLPSLKHLNIFMFSRAKETDYDLEDSFRWMAPSLETLSIQYLKVEDSSNTISL